LIATFLLIGIWGSQNRQYASFQVTIYLMTGSLVLLTGFVALVMALPRASRPSPRPLHSEHHLPVHACRLRHPGRPLSLPFLGAAGICFRAARRRDASRRDPEEIRHLRHDPDRHSHADPRVR